MTPEPWSKPRSPTARAQQQESFASHCRSTRSLKDRDDPDEPRSVPHAIRHVHRAVAEAALVDELEVQRQIGR